MSLKYSKEAPCFGYFYYNDYELLHMPDAELHKRVLNYKKSGAEYVIAFSLTHFRWSFYAYEQLIINAIGRFVKAFHEQGIKFVEHHSSILLWNNEKEDCADIVKMRFDRRESKLENWPLLPDYYTSGWLIDNIPVRSMLVINGNSRLPLHEDSYGAVSFCPNNPDFTRIYLDYLKKLYDLGIDGIMTDDIEFFDGNACACEYCRKDFTGQTGYVLPEPGNDWKEWHGNYDNETFRAWLRFRYDVIRRFHVRVKEHYESFGLKMFFPWYIATAVAWNSPWAYVFDDLPVLDMAFQENIYSAIIRYSWPHFVLEGAHRFALGRVREIAPVSQFYPDREDSLKFSWAVATSCGQGYMGTCHKSTEYPFETESELRVFERENKSCLTGVRKISQIAFFDSLENRRFYKDYNSVSSKILASWAHACMHQNIPWNILLDSEMERIKEYEAVILPETAILSETQIIRLVKYVDDGGILVWCGNTGIMDNDAKPVNMKNFIPGFDAAERQMDLGKGKILFPPEELLCNSSDLRLIVNRWLDSDSLYADAGLLKNTQEKAKRKEIADYVSRLIPEKNLTVNNAPEDLLITLFENKNKDLVIHFVNAVGTLSSEKKELRHTDRIPFPKLSGTISLKIKKKHSYKSASLRCPGVKAEEILFTEDAEHIYIDLDISPITFYGLLSIEHNG